MDNVSNSEATFNTKHTYAQKKSIDRARSRWLRVALEHPVLLHFAAPFTLLLISHIVLFYGFNLNLNLLQEIVIDLLIGAVSFMVPLGITLLLLWREIYTILRLVRLGPPAVTGVVLRLISEELREVNDKFNALLAGGVPVMFSNVPKWVQTRCWATLRGPYIGTDKHLPSEYWRKYQGYLGAHHEYLERTRHRNSVRIIFADRAEIEDDKTADPEAYNNFLMWHKDHKVQLGILSPSRADDLAVECSTSSVKDMACWDRELILLWRYDDDPNQVELQLTFVGQPFYECCRRFLDAAVTEAEQFPGAAL